MGLSSILTSLSPFGLLGPFQKLKTLQSRSDGCDRATLNFNNNYKILIFILLNKIFFFFKPLLLLPILFLARTFSFHFNFNFHSHFPLRCCGKGCASDSDSVSGRARAGKGWKGWIENGRAWLLLINKINYKLLKKIKFYLFHFTSPIYFRLFTIYWHNYAGSYNYISLGPAHLVTKKIKGNVLNLLNLKIKPLLAFLPIIYLIYSFLFNKYEQKFSLFLDLLTKLIETIYIYASLFIYFFFYLILTIIILYVIFYIFLAYSIFKVYFFKIIFFVRSKPTGQTALHTLPYTSLPFRVGCGREGSEGDIETKRTRFSFVLFGPEREGPYMAW